MNTLDNSDLKFPQLLRRSLFIFLKILVTSLLLILFACSANEDLKTTNDTVWKTTGGPGGGKINQIVLDPTGNDTIYVATSSGIYKSTNAGADWIAINTGLTVRTVTSLVINPSDGQIVYAGTSAGVFKSNNGGSAWSTVNNGLTEAVSLVNINGQVEAHNIAPNVTSLAIDPNDTQIVYAGTHNGIFKTVNSGTSWIMTSNGISTATADGIIGNHVWSIVIDAKNSQNLYAGTDTMPTFSNTTIGGIFKSTNGGQTWEAINSGISLNFPGVFSLIIDPSNSQILYAGVAEGIGQITPSTISLNYGSSGAVYKSFNGGASWFLANIGLNAKVISSFAIDPANGQIIYAASGGSIYKSTNGGLNWIAINEGLPSGGAYSLAITPNNSQIVYAGTSFDVYKTEN